MQNFYISVKQHQVKSVKLNRQDLFDFIPVSGLACSYGNIFIPPTYDLGKFKRDLGKRASSLSHMNTMQNFIGK
jgi:hypothetical protein